ncbi:MAG TPA: hypothetical protein VI758_06020 [Bacteroidota bacterium]
MNKKPDLRFLLLFIPVAYLSYLFHEFGHWTVGEILGNEMVYRLNWVWPKSGYYIGIHDDLYTSIGGPAFTILQAIVFLLIIEQHRTMIAYPFVFFAFFMRFFSLAFGGFSKQDEAHISALLNIGAYTSAIVVLLVLFLILWRASHKLRLDLRKNGFFCVASTMGQILVIGSYTFIS